MAINIVRGVVQNQMKDVAQQVQQAVRGGSASTSTAVSMVVTQHIQSGDAIVSNLRASNSNAEKLREYRDARDLAKDLSARILAEGDYEGAHGSMSSQIARGHLSDSDT